MTPHPVCTHTNTHTFLWQEADSFILLISVFVLRSFSKSGRGAENWTGESDKLVFITALIESHDLQHQIFQVFRGWTCFQL